MTLFSDYASISATSSGVSGTINVPDGANLVGLCLNLKGDGGLISSVKLVITGVQQPIIYMPTVMNKTTATNTLGLAVGPAPTKILNIGIRGTSTVTVTVTTTASETVIVGLMWTK
jgi:hypothetical protein